MAPKLDTSIGPTDAALDLQMMAITPIYPHPVDLSESRPVLDSDCSSHNKKPLFPVASVRKRVPWRGKTCIISLPIPPSSTESVDNCYLTPGDFTKSLDVWQDKGYDTAGFRLGYEFGFSLDAAGSQAQSRTPFPDPEEIFAERASQQYQVRIPDQAQWNDYVHVLKEAKLRALGVTSRTEGDKRQALPTISTSKHPPSSHVSGHPSSPSSLPLLDFPMNHTHGIASRPRDTLESVSSVMPSDATSVNNAGLRHFPSYSVAQPRLSPDLCTGYQIPLARSPESRSCTPRNHAIHQLTPRTSSPGFNSANHSSIGYSDPYLASLRQWDNPMLAPYETDTAMGADQQPSEDRSHRALGRTNNHLLHGTAPSRTPLGVEQRFAQSSNTASGILQPVPQGHFDYIPSALEQLVRGPAAGDQQTQGCSQDREQSRPAKNPAAYGKDNFVKAVKSTDYDYALNQDNNPLRHIETHRNPRPPASHLNALAPVFTVGTADADASTSTTSTKMRPTAPSFAPGNPSLHFPLFREFSFLSAGPSFKSESTGTGRETPLTESAVGPGNTMFSTVNLIAGAHTNRRSRAIPIREPRERQARHIESEVQEDESGRITQAEGRQKRIRRSTAGNAYENGTALPLFNAQHANDNSLDCPQATNHDHIRNSSMSHEKAAQAANQLKEIIDDLSASEISSMQEQGTPNADFIFQDVVEAIAFGNARPRSSSTKDTVRTEGKANTKHIDHSGPAEKHGKVYESADRSFSKSLSPSLAGSSRGRTQIDTLPDHDKLNDLRQRELAALASHSDSSASCDSGELLRMDASMIFSTHTIEDRAANTTRLPSCVADGFSYIDPSFEEIDAVMKHLNEESHQVQRTDVALNQTQHKTPNTQSRDDPLENHEYQQKAGYDSASSFVKDTYARQSSSSNITSNISESSRTSSKNVAEAPNAVGSQRFEASCFGHDDREDNKRSFSTLNIESVIANVIQDRLAPLEQSLVAIQDSLANRWERSPGRAECLRTREKAEISDADDEDDVSIPSPFVDRKPNKLKPLISEIVTAQQKALVANELGDITESIKDLKVLLQEAHPSSSDVRVVVEEAMGKQMRGRSGPITSSHQSATVEKNQLQIAGLESMLKIAEARAEDELKARRATEDALADNQRLLRVALQDAAEQRESAEETERSLSAFHEERHEVLRRTALLEGTQESLQRTASDLVEKNGALEGTLEEYRLSSNQWRKEIDDAKVENNDLRRTTHALRAEIEDGIRGRQALRIKFDQLQDEMMSASQNLARDQSSWRIKEEEQQARCEILAADYANERQRRKDLEHEVATLSGTLRLHQDNHHQDVAQYERQIHDQKEMARLERERIQRTMDDDSKRAANELSTTRTRLESIVTDLKAQLRQAAEVARLEKTKFEQLLQEAATSKIDALQERQYFNDEIMRGLKQQHERVLESVLHEKKQIERQNDERLAFAEEKLIHYRDKVSHLEEKLEIARSAAQAAVQAVQSKRSTSDVSHSRGSSSLDPLENLPEKTSPQALRESILVLQEQLQDRESRIEQLEQQTTAVSLDTPARCKAQETEIAWLRELLEVRIDDLQDLIIALAQPVYNREAIKDAAIRLKANIEMEQLEKERALSGSQSFPSFTTISTLASSPRALPLAAAAAWGNWRKGRNASSSNPSAVAWIRSAETPSRSLPSMHEMMPGLLTPPHTDLRSSKQSNAGSRTSTPTSSREKPTPKVSWQSSGLAGRDQFFQRSSPPQTPSLTREASYDADAASADVGHIQEVTDPPTEEEPFGPRIAAFYTPEV
ncbi:MAG: hypothetical protein Q9218_002541 [Villophora microphyllina]